jgi:site-specific DNA-cytosine methylase
MKNAAFNSNYEVSSPTLASFFHGVGGMSKGAERAGFRTLYATDMWDSAELAFHHNKCNGYFENKNFFENDAENILKMINAHNSAQITYRAGDIDLVVSGSPCPGMSGVNRLRSNYDYRNMLMMKQIRVAGMQGLNAKTAWFEQVPGFFDEPMREFRNEVLSVLESQTDYYYEIRVLNALNYGAYQSRDRVTIIMVRKDVGVPSFPEPQPVYLSKQSLQAVLPYVQLFKYPRNFSPKTAHDNVINTMTASSDGLKVYDGKIWRDVTVQERLVLSHLEGYDLSIFTEDDQIRLMGNMVQIPFAEAITRHILYHILRAPRFS